MDLESNAAKLEGAYRTAALVLFRSASYLRV